MKKYLANEWQSSKKKLSLALSWNQHVDLNVNSPGTISISATDDLGESHYLHVSDHHAFIKKTFAGFVELSIESTKPFSYRLASRSLQDAEPMDDNPVPEKKEPTNILQKMRAVIREEIGHNRENFLDNDTPFIGYETDSDEFEEEQLAALEAAKKEQAEKLANPPAEEKPAETSTGETASDDD